MNKISLDHLNLSVENFKKSVEFYSKLFDFELVEEGLQKGEPWGILRSGDSMLCLYQHPGRNFLDSDALAKNKQYGLSHFGLRIHDRDEFEKRVRELQIPVSLEWKHPRSHAWYINDPTGYEIEVALWKNDRVTF